MAGKKIELALQIKADLEQARLAVSRLNQEIGRISNNTGAAAQQQSRMAGSIGLNRNEIVRLNQQAQQSTVSFRQNEAAILGQSNAVKQLATATAAYFSVSKMISSADEYTNLNNRLKLVTDSQVELGVAINDTFNIAQTTAMDWQTVSTIYQRFGKNADQLGLSQERLARITETVSKAVAISGSSAESANAALVQFGQGLAAGVFRGEEFNSVAEQAPALLDAIAQGLGVSTAQLRAMAAEGKITAEVIVGALEKSQQSVDALFNKTDFTIGNAFTRVGNAVTKYVGETERGVGASSLLVNALSGLANNFEAVVNVMGLAVWGLFTQKMIAQATAIKTNIIDSNARRTAMLAELQTEANASHVTANRTSALLATAQAQLAAARAEQARLTGMARLAYTERVVLVLERELTAATAANTAAQAANATATNALTAAKSRLAIAGRAVLGMFGGPLGLLVTGASIGAMYLMMRDNADEATHSLAAQTTTVADLAKQYETLSLAKLMSELGDLRKDITNTSKSLEKEYKKIESTINMLGMRDSRTGQRYFLSEDEAQSFEALNTILDEVKKGSLGMNAAMLQINNLKISDDLKKSFADAYVEVEKLNEETNLQNAQMSLLDSHTETASNAVDQLAKAYENAQIRVGALSKDYGSLQKQMDDQIAALLKIAANSNLTKIQQDHLAAAIENYQYKGASATETIKIFHDHLPIKQSTLDSQAALAKRTDEVGKELNQAKNQSEGFEKKIKDAGNTSNLAKIQFIGAAKGFGELASGANSATKELNELGKAYKSLADRQYDAKYLEVLMNKHGFTEQRAKEYLKAQVDMGRGKTGIDSQLQSQVDKTLSLEDQTNQIVESRKKDEEAITKEKEKQAKQAELQKITLAASDEQTRNMLRVYQAFTKTGISDFAARYMTAEVGREGSYQNKNLFGSHVDINNGYTNTGFISWQKDRSVGVMDFLKNKGLLDSKGEIKKTQEALDAMAEYSVNEWMTKPEYAKSKNALLGGKDYKSLQQIVGSNYIGWDIAGSKLSKSAVNKNISRMDGYKSRLDGILGTDPSLALSTVSKFSQFEDNLIKIQLEKLEQQKANREFYYTDEEKALAEHLQQVKNLNEAGHSPEELQKLLTLENQRYEDLVSKRPEIFKRVQDQLSEIDQTWLRVSGNGIEADLEDIRQKWKQTQADIAALLMSEKDPAQAAIYQKLLLKIDFVIDQEQATTQFNHAMGEIQKLQSLKSTQLDNLKVKYDSGQITQSQYAQQANDIKQHLQPALDKLLLTLEQQASKMEGVAGEQAKADIQAIKAGWIEINKESEKYLPTLDQINDRLTNGLSDAIMDFVDGTKSAGDAFRQFASDFLREIAQMILKQMIYNTLLKAQKSFANSGDSSGGGSSDNSGSWLQIGMMAAKAYFGGFAEGGFTGSGGKYEPAGIVHKGEVVWSQDDIKRWGGVTVVEALRNMNGYADGGIVGAPKISIPQIQAPKLNDPVAQIAQSTSFSANQQFLLVDDPGRLSDYIKSGEGQETIVVMMSRDPAKFKAALKIG